METVHKHGSNNTLNNEFKSYYVVWKLVGMGTALARFVGLNRTM